jgi:hypothetical protein
MVKHPAVSDTLRAALTSRRSPIVASYSLSFLPAGSCPHPPHRHHTRRVLLALVLAARVLTTIVLIDSAYSQYLTRHHNRLVVWHNIPLFPTLRELRLHPKDRQHSRRSLLAVVVAGMATSSSTSYPSRLTHHRTCYLGPDRHPHRHRTRRVLLAVVLVWSYCASSHCF